HHIKQVAAGKASSELRLQLSRQCRDDLLPILRSLLLQDVLADTLADFPVEQGQARVEGGGDPGAGVGNETANVAQQSNGGWWASHGGFRLFPSRHTPPSVSTRICPSSPSVSFSSASISARISSKVRSG